MVAHSSLIERRLQMIRSYGQFLRRWSWPIGMAGLGGLAAAMIAYGPMGQAGYRADPSPVVVNKGSTMSSPSPSFRTNANGQTYGSPKGLPPSEWPDLVLVQDTAGQVGYAYKSQLYSQPTTLGTAQHAAAHNARLAKAFTIPVYDSNGTTVIGRLEVGGTAPTFIPAQSAEK